MVTGLVTATKGVTPFDEVQLVSLQGRWAQGQAEMLCGGPAGSYIARLVLGWGCLGPFCPHHNMASADLMLPCGAAFCAHR